MCARSVAAASEHNGMPASQLAMIFAPILLRPSETPDATQAARERQGEKFPNVAHGDTVSGDDERGNQYFGLMEASGAGAARAATRSFSMRATA